jgi:steroid delta-isomerase-like uncharacterized protein
MSEQNKAIARRLFQAVEASDQAALKELLAPDFIAHQTGPPGPLNREAFLGGISAASASFSDQHYTIEDQIAEGDKVVTRVAWQGTHSGDFQGVPPTGKQLIGGGVAIEHIKDGRIVERWANLDLLGLLQQLGLFPTPSE